MNKNKRILGIIIGVIVLLAVVFTGIFVYRNSNSEEKHEEYLKTELKSIGKQFYEEFFYKQLTNNGEQKKENLEKFSDLGFKISIDSMSRVLDSTLKKDEKQQNTLDKFKTKNGTECDYKATRVIIYPKKPYTIKDYKIDVELVCGNKEKTTKKTNTKKAKVETKKEEKKEEKTEN